MYVGKERYSRLDLLGRVSTFAMDHTSSGLIRGSCFAFGFALSYAGMSAPDYVIDVIPACLFCRCRAHAGKVFVDPEFRSWPQACLFLIYVVNLLLVSIAMLVIT